MAHPFAVGKDDVESAAVALRLARKHVHCRRADEARDEGVGRIVVEVERSAGLLDDSVVHHDDLVGHRHRFDLVMCHVDRRGLQALVQFLDLGAHLHAQLGIEVRQRLIEQEHLRIAHDCASHRDTLTLASGQLARIPVEQFAEAEDVGGARHALVDLRLLAFASRRLNDMLSRTVMCGYNA